MADWFKIYENDIYEMRLQWAIGEAPEVLGVWVVLLSEACRHKSGILSGYCQDFELFSLAKTINISAGKANQAIELLVTIGYLQRMPDKTLLIRKWEEKQSEYCQKKTRLQNQSGDDNPNSKAKRTKNKDIVPTVSGHYPENVGQEERRGEENRREKKAALISFEGIILPESLAKSKAFCDEARLWVEYRMGGKKPKDWKKFFEDQFEGYAKYGADALIKTMQKSRLELYQGLFPEKFVGRTSAQRIETPLRPSPISEEAL